MNNQTRSTAAGCNSGSGKDSEEGEEGGGDSSNSFQRIPSESVLHAGQKSTAVTSERPPKPWERSQSAMDLKNKDRVRLPSMECDGARLDDFVIKLLFQILFIKYI